MWGGAWWPSTFRCYLWLLHASQVCLQAGYHSLSVDASQAVITSPCMRVVLHRCLQFIFTLRNATCAACTPLVFNSTTPIGLFSGLNPGGSYAVSVVGVDRGGRRTAPSNVRQLKMPDGAFGGLASPPPPRPGPPPRCAQAGQRSCAFFSLPQWGAAVGRRALLCRSAVCAATTQRRDAHKHTRICRRGCLACSAPSITVAALNATSAEVDITPPASGGPFPQYSLELCPVGSGGAAPACFNARCTTTTNCRVGGLSPGTEYLVTATGLTAEGAQSPASAAVRLAMPPLVAPTLLSVVAISSTSGTATAVAPQGVSFAEVRTPRGSGVGGGRAPLQACPAACLAEWRGGAWNRRPAFQPALSA